MPEHVTAEQLVSAMDNLAKSLDRFSTRVRNFMEMADNQYLTLRIRNQRIELAYLSRRLAVAKKLLAEHGIEFPLDEKDRARLARIGADATRGLLGDEETR